MKEDKDELMVYYQIDLHAEERKLEVKQVTINVTNEMKPHLEAFENYHDIPITFDSFDYELYKTSLDTSLTLSFKKKKESRKGIAT